MAHNLEADALQLEREARIALWCELVASGHTKTADSSAIAAARLSNGGRLYEG